MANMFGTVIGIAIVVFLVAILSTFIGLFVGGIVGFVFPFVIDTINALLGTNYSGWVIGATLGFVGSFFRSSTSVVK